MINVGVSIAQDAVRNHREPCKLVADKERGREGGREGKGQGGREMKTSYAVIARPARRS